MALPGQAQPSATGVPADLVESNSAQPVLAITALRALPVKGRASMTGYSRARFGTAWADTDHNSCDTRNDVLRRDLTLTTLTPDGCTVLTGTLTDPYSATV